MTFVEFIKRFKEIKSLIEASAQQLEEEITGDGQGKTKKDLLMAFAKEYLGNDELWSKIVSMIISILINALCKKLFGSSGLDPA